MKWSGGPSTPVGNRGKGETPQERATRRLSFLPTESEGLQRNGTDLFRKINFVLFQALLCARLRG
ncbi:hypothetical protein F7732_14680 [Bacillus mesophilum]|uniref:Uncharacterized protein n=1 Tax=Bacillus mesophilum TaxID=1071718 RepID=A0A7V7RKT5_9BACI|nr:hypothetical protein F7732_14680 [Bacillus mesophilum]